MTTVNTETTATVHTVKTKKERNGLIDLYRFLLSLVVVKSHSLFVVGGPYFGPGRVCVEFFFVLSGYLFFSFLEKSKDRSIPQSLLALFKTRVLPLAIPLCIGIVSNVICSFFEGESFSLWGYLWYVEVMFVEMIILIVLRKLIKKDKLFILVISCVMGIALVLKFSGLTYSWGYIRGASTIPAGILLAMIPKLKFKRNWLIWFMLIPVFACCFCIVCFGLGNEEWFGLRLLELLLDNLLYPALIYLSFCLNFKCKVFSYLGALSFGLYAFQCPADLFRVMGMSNPWLLFGFILLATLLEDGGKRLYRTIRKKRIEAAQKAQPI